MSELIDPRTLITLKAAAKLYDYNPEHLRQVAVTGRMKAWFVSHTVWVTTSEHLQEYIRSRKQTGLKPIPNLRRHITTHRSTKK